jgi:hypothetical protein
MTRSPTPGTPAGCLAWVGLWTVLGWAALGWLAALVLLGAGAVGAAQVALAAWGAAVLLTMAALGGHGSRP